MHTENGETNGSRAIRRLNFTTSINTRSRHSVVRGAWIGLLALSCWASSLWASATTCELYPIAVSAATLQDRVPGDVLPDVFNGHTPGNFGWLTWAGSPSVPTLVTSLTPPGNSSTYVNPFAPNDHDLSVGDWVRGKPGVSNSKQVRDALDQLKNRDIVVPVWDLASCSGSKSEYRVSGFARLRLLSYRLPGHNRITARFLGMAECNAPNLPPSVDAGPDQTVELESGAQLNGTATDDGRPVGGELTLQWSQVSGPGTAVFASPNAATTTVVFDLPGTYQLRLSAHDSALLAEDTCLVAVNQPNQPPVPSPLALVTAEDTALDFELVATDPDADPISFRILESPAHGVISGEPPQLRYAPLPDFSGIDRFTFEVGDGDLVSGAVEQLIEITPVNDAPVADPQTLSTVEDLAVSIQLSGADVEGAPLTFDVLALPATGSLSGVPPELIYTPVAHFHGSDSFTFRVSDGELHSAEATVVILVGEINDPPVAFGQTILLAEDSPSPVTLTGEDIEGSSLAFAIIDPPAHGTLSGTPPTLTYVPALNHHGTDAFTFRVDDGALASDPVTVSFEIAPVNDAPVARTGSLETLEDTPMAIRLEADDVDGDPLTYELVVAPEHGTVTGAPPNLIYTPGLNFTGSDTLHFRTTDGNASSETAVVNIRITPVNDPPVAVPQALVTDEGTAVTFLLSGTDIEQDELTFHVMAQPAHGTLSGSPPNLTYLPASDFQGTDQFTFQVRDAAASSAEATVVIEVRAINQPPTVSILAPLQGDAFAANYGVQIVVAATDDETIERISVFANDSLLTELNPPNLDFIWPNPPPGNHLLSAVAVDNEGATGTAGPVAIQVFAQESGDFAVDAGPDQIVVWPATVSLAGTLQTDGAGINRTLMWSATGGSAGVTFANRHALATEVSFDAPGDYELRLAAFDEASFRTDMLRVTVLPPAPERPQAARTSQGRDFWFTLLNNHAIVVEPNYLDALVVVQSEVDTELTLTVHSPYFELPAFEQTFAITGGRATPIELPVDQTAPDLGLSDLVVRNAIHVRAADPVSLWLIQYQDDSSEGTLLLPTVLAGREYRVMAYANSPSINQPGEIVEGSQFAVVATEPDTLVTITPAATVGNRPAGQAFEVLLQPGETYRLIDYDNMAGDVTGTLVQSSKPVSVLGGHTCANVPANVAACNQLVEQLPAIDTWGRRFLTMPLLGRTGGDTFRILASTDDTVLRVRDELLTLDQGQFVERMLAEPAEILASRPVLVAQFANGGTFDSTTGDPLMLLVPPVEQFGGNATFATPPPVWHNFTGSVEEVFTHHANLILPATGVADLRLDGYALPAAAFTPIGNSGFVGAQIPIEPGHHSISTRSPAAVWVYGWADFDAYGFPGGMFSDSTSPGVQLTLDQATTRARVGTIRTVVAEVRDELGRPLADHQVQFTVNGANPQQAKVISNPLGFAVVQYSGTTAGDDVISARLGHIEQSLIVTWLESSSNEPPQVNLGEDRAVFVTDTLALEAGVADDGLPAGASLDLEWRTLDGPVGAWFSNPAAAATTVSFDLPGRYELALTAHDTELETTKTIMVSVLRPATLTLSGEQWVEPGGFWLSLAPGQAVSIDRTLRLAAELSGIPGDGTWNFEFLDGDTALPAAPGNVIELTALAAGSHALAVRATGPYGLSIQSASLLVHVTAPPLIEVVTPLQDRVVAYNEPLNIRANASDPDGSIAQLDVYFGPWLVATTAGGQLDFTGLLPGWGNQQLRFVATDNLGLVVEQPSVQITIIPPAVNVTLTAPAHGQNIRAGMPISFSAEATVGDPAAITEVIFEWWGTFPWEWFPYWHYGVAATTPPYAATLEATNFTYPAFPGSYQYRARAVSTFDGSGVSEPVTINLLPTIGLSIASPTNGAVLYTGNTYPIELLLDDPTGVFASAELIINGGPAIPAPELRLDWTPTQLGNHTIGARAYDHAGQLYAAANVSVQVLAPPLPVVQIIEPAAGVNLETGRLTFVAGEVQDPAGVVTNVTLLVNGQAVHSAATANFAWRPEESGGYTLQLRVQDRLGRQATSPSVAVTVAVEIYVGISHPQENELVPLDREIEVTANVSDPGNMMERLQLLVNNQPVDEADHIHLKWTPTAPGPHTLQVVAWDHQGGSHPSVLIPVTVAALSPPTIQLLSPSGETSWVANHPIPLSVASGDSDGTVIEVQIRSNGRAVLTTNQPSFTFAWLDAKPGWHELIATARDDTGQFTRTDPVRVWVDYEVIPGVPAPGNLRAFSRRAGHNLLSWDPVNVPNLSGYAILRRAEPDGEWRQVGRAEPDRPFFEQSILSARTTYSYQVRAIIGTNHQSGPPSGVTIRTRSVMPEYGILDLTELVLGEAAAPNSLLNGPGKRNPGVKPGGLPRTGPGPVTGLDSFSPVDRGPFRVLGISDANEVLFAHDTGEFTLWFPGGARDLSSGGFQPLRITRTGVVVGSVVVETTDPDGSPRQERWAARWDRVNGLVLVGGDPKLYREPDTHAPKSEPFDAFHLLTDVNAQGRAVGQAAYAYFLSSVQNNDADPHFILDHATLWQGDVPVNLGGVTSLNGFSAAMAINDAGLIVGWGAITETGPDGQPLSTRTHAARSLGSHWSETGGMADLGTLGGSFSAALDVNNDGLAVGYSTLHPEDSIGLAQAVIWPSAATLPFQLPNLGGFGDEFPDGYGYAAAINDTNQIVGESVRGDGAVVATLWQRVEEPENPGGPGTWEAEDLNVLADDDVWLLTNAKDINTHGLIVGQGIKWIPNSQHPEGGEWELRAFLLVPGSLLTDANRDGVIDTRPGSESDDRNRISRLDPWRFWINDDRDQGDEGKTSKNDIPGSATIPPVSTESPTAAIPGTRDLVDFFPLCLDIQGLVTLFPPPEYSYNLEQINHAIRFVETDLSPADSNAYLTDVATARAVAARPLRIVPSAIWPVEGRLTAQFLNRIQTHGSGIILIEGRRPTQSPLCLELRRQGRLVLRQFFGLSISGVEDMYRFKSLLPAGGGPGGIADRMGEPPNYPDTSGSDKNFVFVHGYNVSLQQSRGWQSEIFKRLFWSGSRARFHGVSWYGYQTQVREYVTPDYHVNVENAFQTSAALAAFLQQVNTVGGTTVAAHSLGNMVVSAALQDYGPPVENYFMLDAAVALEAYDSSETRSRTSPNHNMVHWEWDGPGGAYKESLLASQWYTLFPEDDHRRSLTWRGRFDRVPLVNTWNYYSSGEEVLQTHPQRSGTTVAGKFFDSVSDGLFSSDETAVEFSRYTWVLQEKNKGRGLTLLGLGDPVRLGSSTIGGWEFSENDYYVQGSGGIQRRVTPAEANDINPLELLARPFFRKGSEFELYGGNGSEYARVHRDRLLGEMIPARSLPAGANSMRTLRTGFNRDMNNLFQNGWPQSRAGARRQEWRHSDVTDVAYLFVWPLYESFVSAAQLKND